MKFFKSFQVLFFLLCLFFYGGEIKAQDYKHPIQFTQNLDEPHWYRLVINGYFMKAVPADRQIIARDKIFAPNDYDKWCLIATGQKASDTPVGTSSQAGVVVKLYNKGAQMYAAEGGGGWLTLNNTGDEFTIADANYEIITIDGISTQKAITFEFILMKGNGYNGRRVNHWSNDGYRVGLHDNPYSTGLIGRNYTGAVIMQQGIPLSEEEKGDIIPYLNSQGKGGGLSADQTKNLREIMQNINEKVKEEFQGELTIYKPSGFFEDIRQELRNLKKNLASHPSTLADGFYRIKNASRKFYNLVEVKSTNPTYSGKKPVLYANGKDVAWRISTNNNDEVWHVKNNGNNTYTITHVLTGYQYNTAGIANSTDNNELVDGTASGSIVKMLPSSAPAHFALNFGNTTAHALGHNNGAGTSGDVANYKYGSENAITSFKTTEAGTDKYSEPSVWLFEPVPNPPITPLTEEEKIDVWRLIWGSGKAGGIKANDNNDATTDDIGKLARLWNNGSPNQADIPALRTERNRLLAFTPAQRVPFEEGYYRIKNGHDGFNQKSKNARLFENTSNNLPNWANNKTGDETLYYLKRTGDGKYQMINVRTGRAYNGATAASSKDATFPSMEITPVNINKYAGYYKIISPTNTTYPIANSGHATPHGNGDGNNGTLVNYHSPDGGANAKYNFTLPDNSGYAGASTWMFERETNVPSLTTEEQEKVKAVLNAKNVVDGFTQEQLTEFERLETVNSSIGGNGIAPALKAEVTRLLALPYTSRIQYSNGFYVIKNGSYDYYERRHNKVLLMNAQQEGNTKVDRIAWKKKAVAEAGNAADEVWYVERDGSTNKYTFTNVKTLTKIQGFTSTRNPNVAAFLGASDAKIVVTQVDQANRPAQFLLQTNKQGANNDITANPEGPGANFDGTQNGPILSWWGHSGNMDSHSTWMLRKVNENTLQGLDDRQREVKRAFEKSENKYGGFTTAELGRLKTITSPYELVKEINNLRKSTNRIASKNGFVRIFCAATPFTQNKHLYVDYDANKMKWHNHNATAVDEIWVLGGTTGTTRTLMNPNTKTYLNNVNGTLGTTKNIEVLAIDPNLYPGVYEIKIDGSTLHYLDHGNGTGNASGISSWRGDASEQHHFIWSKNETTTDAIAQFSTSYIEVAKTIEIRPKSTAQWVTFNYPFAVKMPEAFAQRNASSGIWACIENSETYSRPNGTSFVFVRPQNGQYVAKEVPMVIEMKPAKNLTLEIVEDAALPGSGVITTKSSIWRGVLAPTAVRVGDYVMRNLSQGNGWYPINNAADVKVAANKVYLPQSAAASSAKFFGMEFDYLEATGIERIENQEDETSEEVTYYDLAGRRVNNPGKGIYITSKGKKVIFK